MLPTKFWLIWPSCFRGEVFLKLANQKQELPVVAMFVNAIVSKSKVTLLIMLSCSFTVLYLPYKTKTHTTILNIVFIKEIIHGSHSLYVVLTWATLFS